MTMEERKWDIFYCLISEPEDKTEIPLLTAGSYSFPFQFELPSKPGLPCSFECGNMAYVRYLVHANMDIAWVVHPVAERYFSFIGSEIDCNLPKYQVQNSTT